MIYYYYTYTTIAYGSIGFFSIHIVWPWGIITYLYVYNVGFWRFRIIYSLRTKNGNTILLFLHDFYCVFLFDDITRDNIINFFFFFFEIISRFLWTYMRFKFYHVITKWKTFWRFQSIIYIPTNHNQTSVLICFKYLMHRTRFSRFRRE